MVTNLEDLCLPYCHCFNSAGGMNYSYLKKTAFVRLGIILYGLKPDYNFQMPNFIKTALEWKSTISMIKWIDAGESVGYGRTFIAIKNEGGNRMY